MAITINVSAGAKRPHPTEQYANFTVQVSLAGEAGSLADVPNVMRDLFAAAQAGADRHLTEQLAAAAGHPAPSSANTSPAQTRPPATSQPRPSPSAGSQPNRGPVPRRGPAPVTDSQLRFLKRLIDQTKTSLPAILDHHQVGGLDQLTCKAAAELIDELKIRVPA